MPRKAIRDLRKQVRALREVEEQLEAEAAAVETKRQRLREQRLGALGFAADSVVIEEGGEKREIPSKMTQSAEEEQGDRMQWKETTVKVQAGAVHEIPVQVAQGDGVQWKFASIGGDVAFCAMLELKTGEVVSLVEKDRVESDIRQIEDKATAVEAGRVWLQFDNSYSWITNKEITYSITTTKAGVSSPPAPAISNGGSNLDQHEHQEKGGKLVFFVLGAPGSGKGTQCEIISKKKGFVHLSAGDLLRQEQSNPASKDGALIKAYIKEGKIVPIEITVKLLMAAIHEQPSACYFIDGFPRNQDNLEGWVRETAQSGVHVAGVLFFDCPDEVTTARLLERGKTSGRADDNEETIKKRLETFKNDTIPIVKYFEKRGQVWQIDTNRDVATVSKDLEMLLEKLIPEFMKEIAPFRVQQEPQTQTQAKPRAPIVSPARPRKPQSLVTGNGDAIVQSHNPGKPLRVILGTMTMGGQMSLDESTDMFETFASSKCVRAHLTAGRMEIDTASAYQNGLTEEYIGRIFGARRDLKEFTFVATKANPFPGFGEVLTAESINSQVSKSLTSMGLNSVDVLYLHAPDHVTDIQVTLEAMQKLYVQGKFREFGLSNYSAWETVRIFYLCKERGFVTPSVYQGMYNAITRDVERELLPALKCLGIRFYAYNPLAGGFLSGKHRFIIDLPSEGRFGENSLGVRYRDRFWKQEYFQALDVIADTCAERNIGMTSASIRWLMHHSELIGGRNDGVIVGASTLWHLEENLEAAAERPLPAAVIDAFDKAWEMCKPACPSYSR